MATTSANAMAWVDMPTPVCWSQCCTGWLIFFVLFMHLAVTSRHAADWLWPMLKVFFIFCFRNKEDNTVWCATLWHKKQCHSTMCIMLPMLQHDMQQCHCNVQGTCSVVIRQPSYMHCTVKAVTNTNTPIQSWHCISWQGNFLLHSASRMEYATPAATSNNTAAWCSMTTHWFGANAAQGLITVLIFLWTLQFSFQNSSITSVW